MYFTVKKGMAETMKTYVRVAAIALGMCAWPATGETNATVAVASEVRTFRLQYASAREVASEINALMSRESGPDGRLLPVAVANAEANTVTVMAAPDKVAACAPAGSTAAKRYPDGLNRQEAKE